jgi:transcriptional regulator with GAF, ATPase, and Fis domain
MTEFEGKTQHSRDAQAALHLPKCKLVVLKGTQRGREVTVAGDVLRIGKSDENDLCLPEDTVSRYHFEILRDAKGYLVRDLGSTNGTFLDGAEIREAYIRAGSVITAGTVQIKFQPFEERMEILPSEKEKLGDLVGRSLRMREIFGLLERVAPTDATILLEGETGVGKDLVAQTVHSLSSRAAGPFIVVDCGAVSGTLIESELFGHEKGAFTGAAQMRKGAFELAQRGTIFLDELGELSVDLQPKLLRVIEQREIRRVGGSQTIKVDIRVVAATKKNLRLEVEKGKFREDLYFRLSVVPVTVPPLRERREDVPLLVEAFFDRLAQSTGRRPELDKGTVDALVAHDWPGNVRELRNVLERAVYLGGKLPGIGLFGQPPQAGASGDGAGAAPEKDDFQSELSYRDNKERWNDRFEMRYLTWLLERAEGNISRAAREADMDRKYLHRLLKKHQIID